MAGGGSFRFGDFTLDLSGRRFERGGEEIALQPQVFATLAYLVERSGQVVTKQELLSELWPDAVVGEAALTRCVSQLRQALGDDTKAPRFVKTVPRVGFRFVADVGTGAEPVETEPALAIAVLPFRPLRRDDRDESLELGMAETLIARLSGLRGLVVRSLGTVRAYADLDQDPLAAGRELQVQAVVDGSLQRIDERLRVTVRVLNVTDGRALVAEDFEEPFRDVFAVQDAICRRIARAVSVELSGEEAQQIFARDTEDPEAYRHFLLGRLALGRLTPDDALRSLPHFERALACDPDYAQAIASISEAWIIRASGGLDAVECYGEARRAAEAALALDAQLGGAWGCLATVAFQFDMDWEASDRHYRRAVELAPDVVDIWCGYSGMCSFAGRLEEGVAHARRALAVDPASPMAGGWLAQALYMAGHVEEAMDVAGATLARAPGFPFALFFMGLCCLQLGRLTEAVDWLEQASRTRPDFAGMLGYAYVKAGREEEAKQLEAALSAAVASGVAPPVAVVPFHAARGDADRLFEAFEETFERRGWHVLLLPHEPILAPYRKDPRAIEMIRRMGLPPPD